MSALDQIALWIGYGSMIAGGLACSGIVLGWSAWFAGRRAWKTFDHLRSIYRLESIRYWFKRLADEKGYALKKEFDKPLEPGP